jgi:hypothetical protein
MAIRPSGQKIRELDLPQKIHRAWDDEGANSMLSHNADHSWMINSGCIEKCPKAGCHHQRHNFCLIMPKSCSSPRRLIKRAGGFCERKESGSIKYA